MSKVKIQGNASGTGVVTLTAPNTNTDRTITLPDSTGSILDSTSTLDAAKLSGALPAISAASLTNIPAANITGTLPAIDGSALTNLPASGLGVGQSWVSVSRSINTYYTNSTGGPMSIYIEYNGSAVVDIADMGYAYYYGGITFIIPNGERWRSNGIQKCFQLS